MLLGLEIVDQSAQMKIATYNRGQARRSFANELRSTNVTADLAQNANGRNPLCRLL
jgi:hypothetical protein